MNKTVFAKQLKLLQRTHTSLIRRKNRRQNHGNGIFDRYQNPVLTAEHTPLTWRYDFNHATNPHLMTRLGVNCVFNVGAIQWNGSIVLMARVEGWDRKSFFAVAESKNGVDNFQFWDFPVRMPELDDKETNLYDMRLVRHEDGIRSVGFSPDGRLVFVSVWERPFTRAWPVDFLSAARARRPRDLTPAERARFELSTP